VLWVVEEKLRVSDKIASVCIKSDTSLVPYTVPLMVCFSSSEALITVIVDSRYRSYGHHDDVCMDLVSGDAVAVGYYKYRVLW
jgi:hypothetical protein